ncbi:MAG TPA: hypothetical protein VJ871_03305, partial [Bacteroidales bacterium]|nr:hypothetical protein [Bacteroidales bacterium]
VLVVIVDERLPFAEGDTFASFCERHIRAKLDTFNGIQEGIGFFNKLICWFLKDKELPLRALTTKNRVFNLNLVEHEVI